jgi:phospholipid N-methyltransferase
MDFRRARLIVELGAGTGAITREILNSLQGNARLTAFEVNREFCDELRSMDDSRLTVHNISAFHMHSVIKERADYVVSGIPLAALSRPEFSRLYSEVRAVLDPGGVFIQVQLAPVSYIRLKHCFRDVRVGFTWRNAPPAFMYCCRGPAAAKSEAMPFPSRKYIP